MIIIIDLFTKKKVMPKIRPGPPKTRPHGPKFDNWYLQFLPLYIFNSIMNVIFSTDFLII